MGLKAKIVITLMRKRVKVRRGMLTEDSMEAIYIDGMEISMKVIGTFQGWLWHIYQPKWVNIVVNGKTVRGYGSGEDTDTDGFILKIL